MHLLQPVGSLGISPLLLIDPPGASRQTLTLKCHGDSSLLGICRYYGIKLPIFDRGVLTDQNGAIRERGFFRSFDIMGDNQLSVSDLLSW